MIKITDSIYLPLRELEFHQVRARGPGGQHVNKAATATQLRFDVRESSMPAIVKERLIALRDGRISQQGVITIKAQRFRSQELNRQDAVARLAEIIREALRVPPTRHPTRVPRSVKRRRLSAKLKRSQLKKLRAKPHAEE